MQISVLCVFAHGQQRNIAFRWRGDGGAVLVSVDLVPHQVESGSSLHDAQIALILVKLSRKRHFGQTRPFLERLLTNIGAI